MTTQVGPYDLDGVVGKGGMGTIHRGKHRVLQRPVAVKELDHPDPAARALFVQEAQLLFGLKHPNFPTVLDLIESGGKTYLVMDFVTGPTLGSVLHARRLGGPEAALVGRGLCLALEFLHGMGVLHRDVKPDNILLPRGLADPVLVDFGIASRLGQEGAVAFTPGMAAPEQVAGQTCGPSSDLYQVGATLFACVTGVPPPDASLRTSDADLGPSSAALDAAGAVAPAVRWSLKLHPGARPASARQLHDALGGVPAVLPLPAPAPVRRGIFDIRR